MNETDIKNKIEASYPLSPMQQGMLFQCQLTARDGIYIQQWLLAIHEEINVSHFTRAWNDVLARHEALRSAFRWEGTEEPVQDIYTGVKIPVELLDWQNMSAAEQRSKLGEFAKLDRKRGFNLAKAPLMRLTLVRLGKAEYELVWSAHHLIISNRTNRIVLEEAFSLYDAYCRGNDVTLPQARPYHDYIEWLRQLDTSKSESYWRKLLEGFSSPTPIGPQRIADTNDGGINEYDLFEVSVPEKVTASLQAQARQNKITLNTIVQGAWALLLSRYSGEEDIVFGEVRANRKWDIESTEPMVGLLLNTLPLRIQVAPEKPLLAWLQEIRQTQLSMREHENTPLIDIQGWSEARRGMPLFNSICVFDYGDLNTLMRSKNSRWQSIEFKYVPLDAGYPISLLTYAKTNLILQIHFNRAQYEDSTIKAMLGHLATILEGMAENINRPLAEIPMLSEREQQQILVDWNDTKVVYPQDKLIHQVFEAQAEKTPDAVAVVFEGQNLTYRELNERANQLAHYLRSIGVGPETLVGIAVERSVEMIVGLYGILKAGGAYVPLDPTYPAERIAYMMQDANVPILLTQQRLREKLPSSRTRVVCLDSDWDSLMAAQGKENPTCETALENLAYLIYTSGSTGKPKGAMNTHAGILNRLMWMQDAYRLTADDAVLQKTPFSFDVSVWEFFWPLMFGARLVVARPEGHKDADYLVRTIIEQNITTIHFVPSMLQIFLMARDVEKCTSLRQVVCSGEALPLELQNKFFTRLNAELHNLYGPTEASVDVTYWECRKDSGLKTVPIGRPVANTQMYILDRNMQPVPVRVAGELYIGGIQVGRGYLNRPELTAERFIPDPFSRAPGARLYKTGDSCRYLPDGNIEYLGRLDFQVKIRGNRIELGEIEALLGQHPAVREAVVAAREDSPGDVRLAAYIVLQQGQKVTIGQLREYVIQTLPDFMVPSYFVFLDKLPLSPNQKVDRKALPAPDKDKVKSEAVYVAPKNELQRAIANVWREVLKKQKVGMNDNFFEIGGHSLLLVRVYYRLCDAISQKFSLTDLFRYPTIGMLAAYLAGENDKEEAAMQESTNRAEARRAALRQRRQARQGIK